MVNNAFVSPCAEWKPRLHRRYKFIVKRQPSSLQTHTAASESDSDFDSNKASSVSSDDSHHSHGTPSPKRVDLEGQGKVNCSVLLVFIMLW